MKTLEIGDQRQCRRGSGQAVVFHGGDHDDCLLAAQCDVLLPLAAGAADDLAEMRFRVFQLPHRSFEQGRPAKIVIARSWPDGQINLRSNAGICKSYLAACSLANPASRSACKSPASSRPMLKRRHGPPGAQVVAVR